MKFLRNTFDNLQEKFGKNKFMHIVIDGFDTFFFAPKTVTKNGVHIRDGIDLKRTMVTVVMAMQLCLLFGMWNIGHQHYAYMGQYLGLGEAIFTKFLFGMLQMLPIIVVSHVVGLGIEFYFAAKKGHPIEEGFLVTGMLIPLIMPPAIPLWMVALATAFAVIIGKEAFGGTGMNILNIALLTRVFIFFAFPGDISGDICWVAYDYNWLHQLFGMAGEVPAAAVDGWTGATPLALAAKGGWESVAMHYSTSDIFFGFTPGSIGEMCKPAIIVGALILIMTGIGSWRIMLSMVVGAALTGLLFNLLATDATPFLAVSWYNHLIMGGFLFAMAFMATDPVTASQTQTGKIFYGFLIGVVGMIVRVLNPAYPEGWMMAILFMNVFAPLIDHFVVQANIKRRLARVN